MIDFLNTFIERLKNTGKFKIDVAEKNYIFVFYLELNDMCPILTFDIENDEFYKLLTITEFSNGTHNNSNISNQVEFDTRIFNFIDELKEYSDMLDYNEIRELLLDCLI